MKFDTKLKINQVINNTELYKIFGCGNAGGMRASKENKTLTIISDYTKNFYEDKYDGGILYYTGMGKEGNQVLKGNSNQKLYESRTNGYEVYWFEVFSKNEYTYRGVVELVGDPYTEMQKDVNGNEREVYIFPLIKIENSQSIDVGMREIYNELLQSTGKEEVDIVTVTESEIPTLHKAKKKKRNKEKKDPEKRDYVALAKQNNDTGLMGEFMILAYEQERLNKLGRSDLAEKIERVSEKKDNVGFDIISYDLDVNGEESKIYIEVKSTVANEKNVFYISRNEVKIMKELKERYWIYRVYNLNEEKPKFFKINGLEAYEYFDFIPENFKVELKASA